MLEMRPACERCAIDLPSTSHDAWICAHECTWCATCARGPLAGRCPNCSGELTRRPATGVAPEHRERDLSRLTRKPDRAPGDRACLDALLDDVLIGTLSTVVDGEPWVVPLLFARDGDRILIHGSTGAGALRHVAAGAPAAFCVMALDGIVVAESTFESSANYRSAVIRGHLVTLTGAEQATALEVLSHRILPGRVGEVRPSNTKELRATIGAALTITPDNWIMKQRSGPPGEPVEDHQAWCGVIPLALTAGAPQPASWSIGPVPASVRAVVAAHGARA